MQRKLFWWPGSTQTHWTAYSALLNPLAGFNGSQPWVRKKNRKTGKEREGRGRMEGGEGKEGRRREFRPTAVSKVGTYLLQPFLVVNVACYQFMVVGV